MARTDARIALNFFALGDPRFRFSVYRKLYRSGDRKEDFPGFRRQRLPTSTGSFTDFWVSYEPQPGFEPFVAESDTNLLLTIDALFRFLCCACEQNLGPDEYSIEDGFARRVSFNLGEYPDLGREVVWLEPYNLRSARKLGFLADFTFQAAPQARGSRRVQQLSLSLDKEGQRNRNFYADRFGKLQQFTARYHPQIFPLDVQGASVTVLNTLYPLKAESLAPKQYVVGDGRTSRTPFLGLRDSGPLQPVAPDARVIFVYQPEHKPLSHDLFRALRGDTFNTFLGMQEMFEFAMTREHVGGAPLAGFDVASLEETCRAIKREAGGSTVVPVVVTPFRDDHSEEASRQYYRAKHTFLRYGFPTQFVSTDLLRAKNSLKWSASNIALGVFAKMGGQPWKMVPRTEQCLILGLGQAHRRTEDGHIERYLAYSVQTDSSGLYEDLRVLGKASDANDYLRDFKANLTTLLKEFQGDYGTFVIHTPFKVRRDELSAIKEVLDRFAGGPEFVVMKFNDANKFFGYATANNSLVPFASSYVRLSRTEYLLWFEGLERANPTVSRFIEQPVHVEFLYPTTGLTDARMRDCLQDALNLSGANWRGFNAKSLPISVYYAQLVARFVRGSESVGLRDLDLTTLRPWFL